MRIFDNIFGFELPKPCTFRDKCEGSFHKVRFFYDIYDEAESLNEFIPEKCAKVCLTIFNIWNKLFLLYKTIEGKNAKRFGLPINFMSFFS